MPTTTDRAAAAREALEAVGQGHVLHFFDKLDGPQRDELLGQIESIDWPEVARLIESHVKKQPKFDLPKTLEPAPTYPHQPHADLRAKYDEARKLGEKLVREGKVAAFTVAGGQGSRLGWDAPKGTFPATPIRKAPLFQVFAEFLLKVRDKWGRMLPWYIMTSPVNDAATRAFFAEHDYFDLDEEDVTFFPQAMMPALDIKTGKVLLAAPGQLALSPNGHGGSLKALYTSGALTDMKSRGVEQISYFQVDNPLVRAIDPLFIGLHAIDHAQMSSKMLPKTGPKERLGNFCLADGKVSVIEYSDLPDELAHQRTNHGELHFRAGSIAIHVIRRDFVESLNASADGFGLPFHRAEKKVPYIDLATGRQVQPGKPNAVKLETFVFDALPLCDASIIYETDRVEEFAPIKNADASPPQDSVDSPYTSKQLQSERAARWLEANGVVVPRDDDGRAEATLEITPRTAIYPQDLEGHALPELVAPGTHLVL
jgi:UDP-N-acetylglucosamine/UDP-N-acetylgalactosamine diphosphorylase